MEDPLNLLGHALRKAVGRAGQKSPLQEGRDTIAQVVTQDTEPDPGGGTCGRRIKQHVAPERRRASEDQAVRHGRQGSSNTCHGFKDHFVRGLDSNAPRDVGGPARPTSRSMPWWR